MVITIGALLVFLSAALRTWGAVYLRTEIVHDTAQDSDALVADGPFRYTRNPLYLANLPMAGADAKLAKWRAGEEQAWLGVRNVGMTRRFVVVAVAVGLAIVRLVSADDNVRAVQMKLRDGGFYSGEIDGAYSSQLAAALTRYQIRNGLPITGQLDPDTSKALGAKPAVTKTPADPAQSSETWRTLRKGEQQAPATTNARQTSSPGSDQSTPAASAESSSALNVSAERLRDYIAAFVLAGLDPHVGAEVDFFADRVRYYDQGVIDREKIREDLQRYAAHWPERRFWLAGDVATEPQNGNRVRVTFPLRYELHNGTKHLSGKIDKTLMLEPAGNDLQIVAINERKVD